MKLSEMIAQRDALDAQIKEITQKRETAIASILTVMGNFGISLDDLQLALSRSNDREAESASEPEVKKAPAKKSAAKKSAAKRASARKVSKAAKTTKAAKTKASGAAGSPKSQSPVSSSRAQAQPVAEPFFEVVDLPPTVDDADHKPSLAPDSAPPAKEVTQESAAEPTSSKTASASRDADTIKEYIYDTPPGI